LQKDNFYAHLVKNNVVLNDIYKLLHLFLQCSLLLEEIPDVLSDGDIQLLLRSTTADIRGCSAEHDEIGSTTTDGVKTCLRLLYHIFCRAVFALSLNR